MANRWKHSKDAGLACQRIEYWFFDGADSAWRNLTGS